MRIFLVRHGEAVKIKDDSILTKVGIKQAKNIAKMLKKIPLEKIFISNLTRAKQTFEEYKKIKPNIKIEVTDELKEIYRVILGGPAKEGTPEYREKKDRIRADNFFKKMISLKEKNVAIFTHGNLIRYFLAKALGVESKGLWYKMVISPGSVSIIEVQKGDIQVKTINLYVNQNNFFDELLNENIISEKYLS